MSFWVMLVISLLNLITIKKVNEHTKIIRTKTSDIVGITNSFKTNCHIFFVHFNIYYMYYKTFIPSKSC